MSVTPGDERSAPWVLTIESVPAAGPDRELLMQLFDQAPVTAMFTPLSGGRSYANRAFFEQFGFEPGTRVDTRDLMAPEEWAASEQEVQDLLEGRCELAESIRHYRRGDGTSFVGHASMRLVRDGDDEVVGFIAYAHDVTEAHEATEKLARTEAWYRSITEHAHGAFAVLDRSGRPVFLSRQAEELVGISVPDEAEEREPLALVHPDDRAGVAVALSNVVEGRDAGLGLRLRIRRQDGEELLVEARATDLLDDPAVGGIVVELRELGDRVAARQVPEVIESRYRRMLENISDTVTLIDGTGAIVDTTGALDTPMTRVLGFETGYWAGRNALELVHPDDVDLVRQKLAEVLASPGAQVRAEFRVRHASGHYEFIDVTAVNLLAVIDVGAIVLTSRNVTDRKQAEAELAAARDAAVRALEQRTRLVANVSHELRTPIHGILGLSELLLDAELSDGARSLASAIQRAAASLSVVVGDLLDHARTDAGQLHLRASEVDLEAVVRDLLLLFEPPARAKGLIVGARVGEGLPSVFRGDEFRLRQVLANLINNAVRYTERGSVTLHIDHAMVAGEPGLRFEVRDSGPGIPPEEQALVFEPFCQGSRRAVGAPGTGLGLTIARDLVTLLGGTLELESAHDVGSTFGFELPVAPPYGDAPGGPSAGRRTETGRGLSGTVLVVDDDEVSSQLVRHQLERAGCEVRVEPDGARAFDAFREGGIDLVLMDRNLPGLDGLGAARRIRSYEIGHGLRRTPIVAMTADGTPEGRAAAMAAGMDDLVVKPASAQVLLGAVASWLTSTPREAGATVDRRDADGPDERQPDERQPDERQPDERQPDERQPDERQSDERQPDERQPDEVPLVNEAMLDGLADELGDRVALARVIRTYLDELERRIDTIRDAIAADDRAVVVRMAHTLRSTSAALGAGQLAASCGGLEDLAANGPLADLLPLVDEIGSLGRQTAALLAARLRPLPVQPSIR